ncbi:MAG: SPFH/Band 7/PHB domain protein [Chloroflexota bacterium]|nr:SPFH/Band 7/PHB domain protein [Chloroflexota bacterium]
MVLTLAVIFAALSIKMVQQANVKVIERLGRYHKTANAGLNVILPFFDSIRDTIDMREQIMRTQKQPVITRDNVTMQVDCVVYWQVLDPVKATYEIQDRVRGLDQMALSTLRNVIGDLDLDHTLTSRDMISTKIRAAMDESTNRWGVKVTRVELMDIEPPQEVKQTMEKQMTAERQRRAAVTAAEGAKQAAILQAEGEKQAVVLRAQGVRDAAILEADGKGQALLRVAQGEADSIGAVAGAIGQRADPSQYLIAVKYLDALRAIAQDANRTVFLPYEASAALASLGGIRELLSPGDGARGIAVDAPKAKA